MKNETDVFVFCEVRDGGTQVVTVWSILKENDGDGIPDSVRNDDPRYSITGKPVPQELSGGLNITYGTHLTILTLTADFDHAMLYCGTASDREAANFIVRIYRELSVYVPGYRSCVKYCNV